MWNLRAGQISGRGAHTAAAGGGGGDAAETTAFLARTSGLDATHTNAYKALINGLVTDGVFAKLDALYIFATDTTTTALLSLVSATYNATAISSPTFTANTGYAGNGSSSYVSSNFNPTTAPSPKFVSASSAILFVWCNTSAGQDAALSGSAHSQTGVMGIQPRRLSNESYASMDGPFITVVSVTDGKGLYTVNRSGASAVQAYKNGSSVGTDGSATYAFPLNANLMFGGGNNAFSTQQFSAGGFGQSLNGTEQLALYNRIRTYLNTVNAAAFP